jgi:N-acetylmuramic acid 6-phosphate etherase
VELRHAFARLDVGERDLVLAIAASGVTRFTRAALDEAARRRARAVFVTCAAAAAPGQKSVRADVVVRLPVGPELVAGSTRLKAGTATKLALNAISTAAMVRLGKVWRGRMVDLVATNAKLRDRAARILVELGGVDRRRAGALLRRAGYRVKEALVAARLGVDVDEARRRIEEAGGRLGGLLGEAPCGPRRRP